MNKRLEEGGRWWLLAQWHWPLLWLLVMLALQFFATAFEFDRPAIEQGQWWRLLSAHFVHMDWQHLLFNGAALILLYLLHPTGQKPWPVVLMAVGVGLGLFMFAGQLQFYRGFSGVLHGLVVLAIYHASISKKLRILAFMALAAKLWFDPLLSAELRFNVIYLAHQLGALTGGLFILLGCVRRKLSATKLSA